MNSCLFGCRQILITAFSAVAFLLSGCGDIPGLDTVTGLFSSSDEKDTSSFGDRKRKTKPEGPVKFTLGDRYTFDNPVERWEIVAIKGEKVYWRSDLGERRITGFDPLLPPQEWYGRSNGKGRRLIRDKEGALFPPRIGASLKFRATVTTDKPPFGWEHNWECRVTDEETLDTLGGPFKTYIVKCGHEGASEITYHYAPKVGNYLVRRTKRLDGEPDSVRNLLSFERADGTVVAGIVADRRAARPKRPAALKPTAPKKVSKPKPAGTKPLPPKVKLPKEGSPARAVNPRPGVAPKTTVPDAIASLGLTEPIFGGRATPPRPDAANVPKTGARVAPQSATARKPEPPPAPAAKPKIAAPSPKKPQTAKRASRVPPAPVLGPRATAPSVKFAPRARVPVPPPPPLTKKSALPAPAAAKPRVPPPPTTKKTAAPSPALRNSRVPPPPIAVRAPPTVPKAPVAAPAIPSPPRAPPGDSIHLASYRSEAAAKQGWETLVSKNDDLLGALKREIRKVAVAGKGTYFRLYAGPVASSSIAGLCRKLNSRGVFCSPAS